MPDDLCAMPSKSPGSSRDSDTTADQLTDSFIRSTVWRVLRKRLHLKGYKLSIVQHLTDAGKVISKEFLMQMFHRIQVDEKFLSSVIFSHERRFHVSGKVNMHNCRIQGSENSSVILEHVRDSPKVNVFCTLSKERL
jgi:hypothetical protein